jgi:U2-associated protein SR140
MSGPSKIREFPDISNKLSAPSKKPLFERQKAEAEAKRQRDEAETAAVYRDFVKSFDDEEDDGFPQSRNADGSGRGFGQSGPRAAFGGASKRHFTPANLKSGPGSLGPASSSAQRKRSSEGGFSRLAPPRGRGGFGQDEYRGSSDAKSAFRQADNEMEEHESPEERAAPKPTIHLSSLVPGMSPAAIKALLPKNLQVDGVRLLPPPTGGSSMERRSASAIVTLAKDTPASDIDAAVSILQNKYLGLGFKLNISRHLSSAVVGSVSSNILTSSTVSLPFGAVPAQLPSGPGTGFGRGQPSHRGGYAPPTSYTPQTQFRGANSPTGPMQVVVKPPSDIKQLKMIHKTLEAVLTHGPEFEALLMSRPDVQREEKWIWLWDARSPGGIWYRWRLWEMLSGQKSRSTGTKQPYSLLFDTGAPWQSPEHNLKFEFNTEFESFVSDPDYDSSDEEEDGEDVQRPGAPDALTGTAVAEYLNPLQKAKLTHLLSRLPGTTARLRKGDVARVTAFAITHAGRGSEEVVNMLLDNVERPYIYSTANPSKRQSTPKASDDEEEDASKPAEDPSSSTLIALYLISDLLSSSSTSGVRHAWRYRQLFESALARRKTFTRLGNMERELGWGRLRAEKWRRAVTQLLQMWESWCVFGSAVHESFVKAFEAACEGEKKEKPEKTVANTTKAVDKAKKKGGGAWKTIDATAAPAVEEDIDGAPMEEEDVDGEPMEEDEDVDGEPMEEDDSVDGEQMSPGSNMDSPAVGESLTADQVRDGVIEKEAPPILQLLQQASTSALPGKRKRPTAADMFADSDEE